MRTIDRKQLQALQADAKRTVYLLDVRTPEEFAAGHLPGSLSAPGGQLIQATDIYLGVRHAIAVLIDDNGDTRDDNRGVAAANGLARHFCDEQRP